MDRENRLNCLQFGHDSLTNEKIDPVSVIDGQVFIANGIETCRSTGRPCFSNS
jgi:hypothetical protein